MEAAAKGPATSRQVSAVNQTWTEGQPRGAMGLGEVPAVPFEVMKREPYFRPTPGGAAPASELFQAPRAVMGNTGTDAAVAGAVWGGEAALATDMGNKAHDELTAAYAALEKDKSEQNIQRYQAAKDNVAFWDMMFRAGVSGGLTHLGSGPKAGRTPARPSNLDQAEAMQMDLMQRYRQQRDAINAANKKYRPNP